MSAGSSSQNTLPRRSAMKGEDGSEKTIPPTASSKAVSIAEPESASPDEAPLVKQFTAGLSKKLSGRSPFSLGGSSRTSLQSQTSLEGLSSVPETALSDESQPHHSHHRHHIDRISEKLLAQVAEWIQHEKTKKATRRMKGRPPRRKSPQHDVIAYEAPEYGRARASSNGSESSEVSLDRLQKIVEDSMAALGLKSAPALSPRLFGRRSSGSRRKSQRSLQVNRTASSDTDFFDGDVVVPSCDVVLDNSKTMSYSGGKTGAPDDLSLTISRREEKERQAWISFKNEIVRLAHTLKLKGWRRVPLESGDKVSVERLSGALTNAVYVVSPPEDMTAPGHEGNKTPSKLPPPKLLLRVYGPQVEHLIDREHELGVLQRLARKKIGPRLLGTFTNGRFEEFFNSTTLTPANLREPDTSKQIAKRMRELHDGIELLEEERDGGPAVWKNWDHWLDKVEQTVLFLDNQILDGDHPQGRGLKSAWRARGFICGVEWRHFKSMVEKYRTFLHQYYGDSLKLRERLVFAHNDTQYGNILRIRPDDEKSPLLQPANEHKQLVVIDFEYAAANVPGLEFANHFTEWSYDYHDPVASYMCNTAKYPSPGEQHRFIKAYIDHHHGFPHRNTSSPSLTPLATPTDTPVGTPALATTSSSSSIVDFMLDARVPPGGWKEEEKRQREESEARIKGLMEETRLWRIANSAQWVAWGIIQAKVPGLPVSPSSDSTATPEIDMNNHAAADAEEVEAGGFDYLAYAQERALFFWGDCVLMGLVKAEDLPEGVQKRIKLVDY